MPTKKNKTTKAEQDIAEVADQNQEAAKSVVPKEGDLVETKEEEVLGAAAQIDASDMTIPEIRLAQNTSKVVTEGEASPGDLYNTLDSEVVAKYSAKNPAESKSLEVIIFDLTKTWVLQKYDPQKQQWVWHKTLPITSKNAHWGRSIIGEDGQEMQVNHVLNYHVLLPSEISEDEAFPAVFRFRSTGLKAAKKMGVIIKKLQMKRLPSWHHTFILDRERQSNDKGTFFVPKISKGRVCTKEEKEESFKWFNQLKVNSYKIHEADAPEAKAENTEDIPF